jgi:hypothetical protein
MEGETAPARAVHARKREPLPRTTTDPSGTVHTASSDARDSKVYFDNIVITQLIIDLI